MITLTGPSTSTDIISSPNPIKRQRTKVICTEHADKISRRDLQEQLTDVLHSLAQEAGFKSIDPAAEHALMNVFFSYWRRLLMNSKLMAELAGHNSPSVLDVAASMQRFNTDVSTLASPHVLARQRPPSAKRERIELEDAEFMESDSEDPPDAAGSKLHIYAPEYCPPLPPRHTFRNTSAPGIPEGSLQFLEAKAIRQTGIEMGWERLLLNTMDSGVPVKNSDPDISDIRIMKSKCNAIDFAKDPGSTLNWAQDRYKRAGAHRLWSI